MSYDSSFSLTVFDNTDITAVYSDSAPSEQPHVRMSNTLSMRDGYKTYVGQFYVPDDYELIEYGMMTSADTQKLTVNSETANRREATKYSGATNEFVMSFADTSVSSVEPYLVVKNASGDLETVYATPSYNLWNGGFETGDTEGWNRYNIWKGESGIQAFVDDLIVDDTYFTTDSNSDNDNYTYNRDGNWNIGIEASGIEWNQAEERMGHLRSADFTLAGSGWVSFKLGGGNTDSFAYVSVRKASDDTEVARFGNRHYNDTGLSGTDNAEAYMFPYYYDLSSLSDVSLGDELYFVLSDTSSYNWSILSADSFQTYYPTAPSPSTDEEAVDILPNIPNVATASNSIPNGYFDNGLDDWANVDGIYRVEGDGKAYSKEGGDDALGVLRSSAFTIDGTDQYLQFGWGGGLKYDKQIFLSIKEVGTNIEVMRIVRRDNLSDKDSDNLDNHMVNLTGLDTSKTYYLEFGDNLSASEASSAYTVLDEIRLVDQAEWDSVIDPHPGDEAVYISGLTTDYTYRLPE